MCPLSPRCVLHKAVLGWCLAEPQHPSSLTALWQFGGAQLSLLTAECILRSLMLGWGRAGEHGNNQVRRDSHLLPVWEPFTST